MIFFLMRKEHVKEKEEHGCLKACEANQCFDDSSLNTIMIKYQKFSLNQKKKAIFHKLTKNKRKNYEAKLPFQFDQMTKRDLTTFISKYSF